MSERGKKSARKKVCICVSENGTPGNLVYLEKKKEKRKKKKMLCIARTWVIFFFFIYIFELGNGKKKKKKNEKIVLVLLSFFFFFCILISRWSHVYNFSWWMKGCEENYNYIIISCSILLYLLDQRMLDLEHGKLILKTKCPV